MEHTCRPRRYLVTGADSGLGYEVARLLARTGDVVTCGVGPGVDVRADLARPAGRAALVEQVLDLAGDRLDAVVAVAGSGAPRPETVALNYFGTVEVLDGLRSALASSSAPAAVVVSSSSTLHRGSGALVRACARGDEQQALATARHLTRTRRGSQLYRSSKIALNHWVRSAAPRAEWAGQGIVLNAVAPGIVATEAVTRTWERDRAVLETALPQPLGAPGPVAPVTHLLAHLVSAENRSTTGQVVYCDGGTDALVRGTRPQRTYLRYGARDVVAMWRAARSSVA